MNKFFYATTAVLCLTAQSHALVVSDPGAYTRQAQQIQKMTEQLSTLKDTLEETKRAAKNLEGNLKRGRGIQESIQDFRETLEKSMPTFLASENDPEGKDRMEIVQQAINEIFKPNAKIEEIENSKRKQENYRQRAAKSAVIRAETTISDIEQSVNKMEALARQIDDTQSIKDSADLNNRLQHEMMLNQNKIIVLLAEMARAENAEKLRGVSDNNYGENAAKTRYQEYQELLQKGNNSYEGREEFKGLLEKMRGI